MRKILYIVIMACLLPVHGCVSKAQDALAPDIDRENKEKDLQARPFFDKPSIRPLARVLISWSKIDDADGYELQMSHSESFERVIKNWIMSGISIELPVEAGATRWYRVRSFTLGKMSRWSFALRLNEKDLR